MSGSTDGAGHRGSVFAEERYQRDASTRSMERGYGASFFSGRREIGKEELEEWRKLLGR